MNLVSRTLEACSQKKGKQGGKGLVHYQNVLVKQANFCRKQFRIGLNCLWAINFHPMA